MKTGHRIAIVLPTILLAGCELLTLRNNPVTAAPVEDRVLPDRETRDTLLEFAARLVSLPDEKQRRHCEAFYSASNTKPNEGSHLRSVFAVTATPYCGELDQAMQQLQDVSAELEDEQLENLITYQNAILERLIRNQKGSVTQNLLCNKELNKIIEKNVELEAKLKKTQTELSEIQAKFDALKSIEENLNRPTEEVIIP